MKSAFRNLLTAGAVGSVPITEGPICRLLEDGINCIVYYSHGQLNLDTSEYNGCKSEVT